MTVVVDNCLPLSWVDFLRQHGHVARHWRELGPPNAPDAEIMRWACQNDAVVLTQDLDFTSLLFQSRAALQSVIQLRLDDVRPQSIGDDVCFCDLRYAICGWGEATDEPGRRGSWYYKRLLLEEAIRKNLSEDVHADCVLETRPGGGKLPP